MAQPKKLYRSTTDKQIAGVCGGLGKYLGIDPTLIRVAFVLLLLVGGQGGLLYLILAIVIPEEPLDYTYAAKRKRDEQNEDIYDESENADRIDNGSGTA